MTHRLGAALVAFVAFAGASALAQTPPTAPLPESIRDIAGLVPPPLVASIDALSSSEIQEAMAFGRHSAKLKAYQLSARRNALVGGRARAALLTPFLRVATATQVAAATSQPLIETGIPPWLIQKLVWIVGFPAENYIHSSDMDSPLFLASVTGIAVRPVGSKTPNEVIQPAWQLHLDTAWEVNMFESLLGRQFNGRATIAAFPMTALQAGSTILFTYSSIAPASDRSPALALRSEVRSVKIAVGDVRKWK
jgi:hypothetical protein